jgi:hypothetical protein
MTVFNVRSEPHFFEEVHEFVDRMEDLALQNRFEAANLFCGAPNLTSVAFEYTSLVSLNEG